MTETEMAKVKVALLRGYEAVAKHFETSARWYAEKGYPAEATLEQREATRARWKAMALRQEGVAP